jgi:hypothetical protein
VRRPDTETLGHKNQIGQRLCLHFAHHHAAMLLCGFFCVPQFAGNLLVEQAGRDQREDFALARGECGVSPL